MVINVARSKDYPEKATAFLNIYKMTQMRPQHYQNPLKYMGLITYMKTFVLYWETMMKYWKKKYRRNVSSSSCDLFTLACTL